LTYESVPFVVRQRVRRTVVTNPTLTIEQVAARSSAELEAVLAVLGGPGAKVETSITS
jgi:hypothetical protein